MSELDAPLPPKAPGSRWVIWYGGECIEIPQDVVDKVLAAPSGREANRIGMEWLLSRPAALEFQS